MKTAKEFLIALFQGLCFAGLLPLWLLVGAYLRFTRRDHFRCLACFAGLCLFPAFGRWWLPFIWINN